MKWSRMELRKLITRLLLLLLSVNFVCSSKAEILKEKFRRDADCTVSLKNLNVLRSEIAKHIDVDSSGVENDCDQLIAKIIGVSSKLRNSYRRHVHEVKSNFNETRQNLRNEERNLSLEVPEESRAVFSKSLITDLKQLEATRETIESEVIKQRKLNASSEYYNFFNALPSDNNFNASHNCRLSGEKGKRAITILEEVYAAVEGKGFDDNCHVLIKKMMNIAAIIRVAKGFNEKSLDLLKETFDERKRIIETLKAGNAIEGDHFEDFYILYNETVSMNKEIRENNKIAAFDHVVKTIIDGSDFDEAQDVINQERLFDKISYSKVLVEAYNCNRTNLYNVLRFAEFNRRKGFEEILEKMKSCQQLDDHVILKINRLLGGESLESHVEKIYEQFAEMVRRNNNNEVVNFANKFNRDAFDVKKLVKLAFNRNVKNFESVAQFIDDLDFKGQNLEKLLYDELIENGHIDTVEHVMFGKWLKVKIRDINMQLSQSNHLSPQTEHDLKHLISLNKIKNRLPEGIRNLFFEPYIILESGSLQSKKSIRGFGYESVKFNAIPTKDGRYFRIEDTRNQRALFSAQIDKKDLASVGKGIFKEYYWQIVPTQNAKYFLINSFDGKLALSSNEHSRCSKWKRGWIWQDDKCVETEEFNLLSDFPNDPSTKWTIKSQFIADGVYPMFFPTQCGRPSFIGMGVSIGGNATKKGEWPFLAALFEQPSNKFFCAGTIITQRNILTAAHCIEPKYLQTKFLPENVTALLGRFNIASKTEQGSVHREVLLIQVHEDWNSTSDKFDADLAILFLKESVEFSSYIKPICLSYNRNIENIKDGVIVGWGNSGDHRTHVDVPLKVDMKSVSDGICFTQQIDVALISSHRNFCADGNNAGPCKGDSGGGYMVNDDGSWTLRGIVSASLFNPMTRKCAVEKYSIYTRVFDFISWIKDHVLYDY